MFSDLFPYEEAFSRNIGLLSFEEQKKLREFRIAIPGMGGVGGRYLIELVRQGFQKFNIADYDSYELCNFNRQYGANLETMGRPKVEVMKQEALKINPDCDIRVFNEGINRQNLEEFLRDSDLALDGLDFFAIRERRDFINKSCEKRIPLITAGPIGFGVAYLIFMPNGPNFDKYFGVDEETPHEEMLLRYGLGLAPKMLQLRYMKGVNFKEKKGPSSAGAISLCSGIIIPNMMKILFNKGKVKTVPYYHQFDPYLNKYICKRRFLYGKRDPLKKLKIKIGKYMLERS